ncbi:DNA adenine methylase [Marine Group I thaumarchaeote]|uniref:site-specific DNA-methyltransferase (adenine-specific) n=1 Tax=Marine Group I thaumarchaeote TaxID=2511932 RepID=A0A7K4NCQ6_9ARCH|nr:DNA adenine methylase [Marine Group I thaumarchaeote]
MQQVYSQEPRPFVKWAGGKRQLLHELERNYPKKFGTYFEPFLGGGAVMFNLLAKHPDMKCHVSDLNSDLILTYVAIRDKVTEVIESLENHSKKYQKNTNFYYYHVRESEPTSQIEKVSKLIFLNKTCFNGLYRVNRKGKFNVPLGRYTNPNIVNKENLLTASRILQSSNLEFFCRDFETILHDIKKGDFVYFDPPYQPVSNTANFTSYTNRNFTDDDLERLVNLAEKLDSIGCKVLLSNSKSKKVENSFSSSKWKIKEIQVNRAINSDSKKRTGHSEILVKNY